MIAREKDLLLLGEHHEGYAGLGAVRKERPDLLFLGVKLGGLDGFELLQATGEHAPRAVIFVSSHEREAARAFSTNAVDFLLPPFKRERFQKALQRARERLAKPRSRAAADAARNGAAAARPIGVRAGGRIVLVRPDEIEMIVAHRSYSAIHVRHTAHRVRSPLSSLQRRLPAEHFVRINRSTLINIAHVREIRRGTHGDGRVRLDNGTELPLSRRYRPHWSALVRRGGGAEEKLDVFIERVLNQR